MKMKQKYTYMIMCAFVLLLGFSACDKDAHENEYPVPDGTGGLVVGLETDGGKTAEDVHFFVFDASEGLVHHEYFDDPHKTALHISYLTPDTYIAVAVLNTGADFMPPSTRADGSLPDITLPEFADWLKGVAHRYPELLTGIGSVEVTDGEVAHITIRLQDGTDGVRLPKLRLLLTLPEPHLPDYTPATTKNRAAKAGYSLRCVAELCIFGTDNVVLHKAVTPELQADGTYLVELEATEGNYDLHLWTDYAWTDASLEDTYYHTTDLKAVTLITEPGYTANTDAKDAAYFTQADIHLAEAGGEMKVELQRPLAKYRLIATDVEEYNKLREQEPEKFPSLEELIVTVAYENFFPSTFNVVSGKPTSSLTGITFTGKPYAADGITREILLATDWIIVNGTDSSVRVTIRLSDKKGNLLGTTTGCPIAYRRGCLATVRGKFLTAGIGNGGVSIDTEWKDSFVVEF